MAIKKLVIKPTSIIKNPTQQISHIYKGFSSNRPDQNFKIYDLECIKQDILNQFNVRKFERVMQPKLGTVVWDSIFEPLTESLKNKISEDIREILTNEPRIIVEGVRVDEYQSGIIIELTMRYRTNDLTETMKLTFDRELGLTAS